MESLSSNIEIRINDTDSADAIDGKVERLKTYLFDRVKEIEDRIREGSRSIFDFADMAIVISALSEVAGRQDVHHDGERFKEFVQESFFDSADDGDAEVVAAGIYHLLRCGLVHELSLAGHRFTCATLSGYSLVVTHDQSPQDSWYRIPQGEREIWFYAHELIRRLKECIEECFTNEQKLHDRIVPRLKEGVGYVSER